MLRKTPQDLDLATLLRERALQYDGCDITPKGGSEWIARASLNYIKRCGIPYLNHVHPPDRKVCIICEFCLYFSVVDLDWQNDPQADAAAFISSSVQHALSRTGEVGDHPNDLDEARNPSSVFPSNSEAFSVAELPLKPKRKREEQSTPAGLWRSTRLRVKKAAS
ncbi:hypothetical protein BJ912DRAFT_177732 [Pholiota molesta]|nr:hypothetical protein BJ912DRAFT_177732 [Pholiota molesta]